MSLEHDKYGPIGWSFDTDHYCNDCIVKVIMKPGKGNGGNGTRRGECNCWGCRFERIARAQGWDPEGTYDQTVHPQAILYGDSSLHADCGNEVVDSEDVHCNGRCSSCHEVINGVSHLDGPDTCPTCDKILGELIDDAESRVWEVNEDAPEYKTWKKANADGTLEDYEGKFTSTEVTGQQQLFDSADYTEFSGCGPRE